MHLKMIYRLQRKILNGVVVSETTYDLGGYKLFLVTQRRTLMMMVRAVRAIPVIMIPTTIMLVTVTRTVMAAQVLTSALHWKWLIFR